MRISHLIYASTLAILVASCASKSEKATKVVEAFASAVAAQDSTATVKAYPKCKDFYANLPKLTDIEIQSVEEKDSIVVVKVSSSYYNENNAFTQKQFTFWTKKAGSDFIIYDSNGLLTLPNGLDQYAYNKGALTHSSNDVAINTKMGELAGEFYMALMTNVSKLNNGIKTVSWSWEADFGTPHGRATVKNELPFAVKGVKYKVTYFNGSTIVGSDDGTVAYDEIEPGAMKSFTFYSSGVNGYSARSARLEFEVPEKYAYEWTISGAN